MYFMLAEVTAQQKKKKIRAIHEQSIPELQNLIFPLYPDAGF